MEELVTLHDDAHMDFLLELLRLLEVLLALHCEVLLASCFLASLQLVPVSDQRSQQFLEVVLEVVRSQQFLEVVLEVVEVPLRFGRVQDVNVVVVEVLAMDEVAYVHLDHLCGHSGTPAMWQGAATAAGWRCSR